MSKKVYCVVEFLDSKDKVSAAVVPKTWLGKNGRCSWPSKMSSNKIDKLLKKFRDPEKTWALHAVKILAETNDYAEANKKLQRSLRQTDCELSESAGALPAKRRVIPSRKRRLIEETSSDTDDDDSPIICPPPVWRPNNSKKSAKKYCYLEGQHSPSVLSLGDREDDPSEEVPASFTKSRCSDRQYNEPDRFFDNTDIDSGEEVPSVISSTNQYNPVISAESKTMGRRLVNLQSDVNRMSRSIQRIEHFMVLILPYFNASMTSELPSVFPIQDGEKLQNLDQLFASEPGVFERMVKTLANIGGDISDDFMRRVMPRLLKNEFANRCSVFGRNDKFKLKNTMIFKGVFAAVKMNINTKDCTEKDIERAMRKWITNSRDRAGGSRFMTQKNSYPGATQDCNRLQPEMEKSNAE